MTSKKNALGTLSVPKMLLLASLLLIPSLVVAQGRSYIRDKIKEKGTCRNVAITKTNGDLMLYGRNGWAGSNLPSGLSSKLNELNDDGEYIDDVQLTEDGSWLILYGKNNFWYYGVPSSLERKMKEYNDRGDVITSVTFNDSGDWIIISTDYFAASNSAIQEWLNDGLQKQRYVMGRLYNR